MKFLPSFHTSFFLKSFHLRGNDIFSKSYPLAMPVCHLDKLSSVRSNGESWPSMRIPAQYVTLLGLFYCGSGFTLVYLKSFWVDLMTCIMFRPSEWILLEFIDFMMLDLVDSKSMVDLFLWLF